VYRFIQEGLNNAFRHARGEGQHVKCSFDGSLLTVAVEDGGSDDPNIQTTSEDGMGLAGLRDRVESLGGTFSIYREQGAKTRIEMNLVVMGTGYDG
jgi:signal transduction histidine kinase